MDFNKILYSFINILNEMSPYILLGFIIAGILHVFVKENVLTRHLAGNGWKSVVKSAAIGIPLPLCSCGVLPTAVSLHRQGASKAATTSFLIATPQTGVDSIAATYSLLGLPFALIRPIAALMGAVFGGMAVGRLVPDKQENITCNTKTECHDSDSLPLHKKLIKSVKYGFIDMVDTMGKWLVIGLVIATLITIFVPDSLFTGLMEYPLLAMLLMVMIAVPMYVCATGSIPIAMSLMLKGLSPGVAFVLLMAGPAANFASILILNRTQGKKATAIYVVSVIITAIVFGLIIDYLLPAQWFELPLMKDAHHMHSHLGWFESACSIILLMLLAGSAFRTIFARSNKSLKEESDMMQVFNIEGMNCNHCRASVEKAIGSVDGVTNVEVNLIQKKAFVTGDFKNDNVIEAVNLAGFEASI